MVAAPVGFQCRECVAAGAASAPVNPSTRVGGRGLFAARAGGRPYVTYAIVAICVVAFLAGFAGVPSPAEYGMVPALIGLDDQWYRLMTSAFLHGGILHVAFNMLVLIMIGPVLELVLGHVRFLALYLLAAFGGAVASYCFSPVATISVGASGAIFGLMGALLVAGRRLKYDITQVAILLGVNLVIGFLPGTGVDWRAHLGGLVTGAAVAFVLAHPGKLPASLDIAVHVAGCLVIFGLLIGAVVLRTDQLRTQFPLSDQTSVLTAQHHSGTLGARPDSTNGSSQITFDFE